jgi:hypothetical protein
MDVWSVIIPIITGIAGWLAQQYLKPLLPKRERRISDKEMLKVWHGQVFKRWTFIGKFDDETIGHRVRHTNEFETGIEETIRALETGNCLLRGSQNARTKGADYIRDKELKDKTKEVIERLRVIHQIMKENRGLVDELGKYSSIIDKERDEIFKILNPFWEKHGLEPLLPPSKGTSPKYK